MMKMLEVMDTSITYSVQEAERRRIARELHDGVVQSLTALLADLEYFRTCRLSEDGGATQEVAVKVATWQDLARDCLVSMRQALSGLRTGRAAERELETLIQALLLEMEQEGYTVTYACTDWPGNLPQEYISNLYAIVREALTNICKHAQASRINVFMFSHRERLYISIRDDGVGIAGWSLVDEPGTRQDGYHLGLVGLHERAVLLGGQISIESRPGKGT